MQKAEAEALPAIHTPNPSQRLPRAEGRCSAAHRGRHLGRRLDIVLGTRALFLPSPSSETSLHTLHFQGGKLNPQSQWGADDRRAQGDAAAIQDEAGLSHIQNRRGWRPLELLPHITGSEGCPQFSGKLSINNNNKKKHFMLMNPDLIS